MSKNGHFETYLIEEKINSERNKKKLMKIIKYYIFCRLKYKLHNIQYKLHDSIKYVLWKFDRIL